MAKPFLKWAGGKRKLLPELVARMPKEFHVYHEPFLGGGALFFEIADTLKNPAWLSDINKSLMSAYWGVRDEVDRVMSLLLYHKQSHSKEYYYYIRDEIDPEILPWPDRAARVIYLNKTCFNGLYRENKSGKFNVPMGQYKNPAICDKDALRSASLALQNARLRCHDFQYAFRYVGREDFVYLDPPYRPISETSSFTSYDSSGFSDIDQLALRAEFEVLSKRGAYVMLSNSNSEWMRDLYKDFYVDTVYTGRAINRDGAKRGKVSELIIRNYGGNVNDSI